MIIRAPGKINLALDVLRKREDGFHEIRSLMVSVGLEDELSVEPNRGSAIELTCDSPGVPCDESNLVYRAAAALKAWTGVDLGCRIHLTKRIPIGAGMGGGSSDAASTLLALNQLWQLGLDQSELVEIAASIGSDVPFFFWPGGALVFGRGERIEPVEMKWRGWAGLVSSGDHVSTAEVYDRCKPRDTDSESESLTQIANCKSVASMGPLLHNDLESSVFETAPRVRSLRDELIRSGIANQTIRVTGAGSVLFQLFDDEAAATVFASMADRCPLAKETWVVPVPARC